MRVVYAKSNTPRTADAFEICTLAELERIRAAVQARPFDPSTLVAQALLQWSELPHLAHAFAQCTQEWPESDLYTHFIAPAEMEARWQFAATLPLAHPQLGTLMVEIIHDASAPAGYAIGGIEYLDRVMGRHMTLEEFLAMMDGARAVRAKWEGAQRSCGGSAGRSAK